MPEVTWSGYLPKVQVIHDKVVEPKVRVGVLTGYSRKDPKARVILLDPENPVRISKKGNYVIVENTKDLKDLDTLKFVTLSAKQYRKLRMSVPFTKRDQKIKVTTDVSLSSNLKIKPPTTKEKKKASKAKKLAKKNKNERKFLPLG